MVMHVAALPAQRESESIGWSLFALANCLQSTQTALPKVPKHLART